MSNNKYFIEHINEYDIDFWRSDEESAVNRYFPNQEGKLLVLGCGAGRTLPYLHKKGFTISALDVVPEMVTVAEKRVAGMKNVEVFCMDASSLKFSDNSFDYAFFPFHGLGCVQPDIWQAVKEVARVLKRDGTFVFNLHNRLYLKGLQHFLRGKYVNHGGVTTYHTTPLDILKLREYFTTVCWCGRVELQDSKNHSFKDSCYKALPFVDKSIYYICSFPKI